MKLLKCHVENFGCLKNYDLSFGGGLTSLYAPNGGGKSTLAAFIRAMFYGLPANSARTRFNARRHYFPFSGGAYGGSLTFGWRGREYRIERFFDETSGDDKKWFCDGSPAPKPDGEFGEVVFGLDEESFARTLFFGGGTELCATPGISAGLGDYASQEVDGERGREILSRAAKKLSGRGGRGEIAELERSVRAVEAELKNMEDISLGLDKKYAQRAAISSRLSALSDQAAARADWRKLGDISGEINKNSAELARLEASYPQGFPARAEVEVLRSRGNKKGSKLPAALSFALSFILMVAGALLCPSYLFAGIAALAAGAVFFVATLCVLFIGRKKHSARSLRAILKKYGYSDRAALADRLEGDIALREQLQSAISAGQSRMNEVIGAAASEQRGEGEGERLRRELAAIDRDISDDESILESREIKLARLSELGSRLGACRRRLSEYAVAAECIAEAQRSLTRTVVGPVAESFKKYSALVKNTLGDSLYIDKNFSVAYESDGRLRPDGHLSAGQRAVANVCYRLAVIDNIFRSDIPFVVLDDPFSELDGERMEAMAKLLPALARDRQIIYLYCHPSRKI